MKINIYLNLNIPLIYCLIKILSFIIIYIFINYKKIEIDDKYYFLSEYFGHKNDDINQIFFNFNNLIYSFSFKYNIVEIKYNINFYDKNKTAIKPSDLTLFNNLFIICHMKNGKKTINIDSLANIYQNKHYFCIQYFHVNEKVKSGVKICLGYNYCVDIYFFYNNKIRNENPNNTKFDPKIIENEYLQIKNSYDVKNSKGLTQFYIDKPYDINIIKNDNNWTFKNIYNNYFCICKGLCKLDFPQLCKYLFYLFIIDKNKDAFNKTDFLLSDFFYFTSDDTFPLFKEMIKRKINAHYIDGKKNIYNQFCNNEKKCSKVLSIYNEFIDGDFLERNLDIILKLKAIIAGHQLKSFYNIFYYIDYIAYINLGHGIKFFKHFLYSNYSSYKKYNKIVLPPSKKIISVAKQYGWTEDNIIKNCLPKWDKYDIYKYNKKNNSNNKSIFIMFTWRNLLDISYNISSFYLNNIIYLINNEDLLKILKKNNITLYFTFHPNFQIYKSNIKYSEYIKYIEINDISDCLMKSNLLISDFSSIIFDMIYQRKPFVIFIPDAYDSNIQNIYEKGYYEIINNFKNGNISFKNIYLNLRDAIKKIIYYIENNFTLEIEMENFYDSFEFNCKNSTNSLINYLINEL